MPTVNYPQLDRGFSKDFEILPALTGELRDEAYRIRHRVYCEELHFEPLRQDHREHDGYDSDSLHCLLRYRPDDEYIGCVRVVRGRSDDSAFLLPFERTCSATLDRSIIDPSKLPREAIGEVSRLAVINQFRRRRNEHGTAASIAARDFGTGDHQRFPYIPVSLYFGVIGLCAHNGIDTVFSLTEPRLAKHFDKLGITIRQIGEPIEHRGKRVPSVMDVHASIRNIRQFLQPLLQHVMQSIEAGYTASSRVPA